MIVAVSVGAHSASMRQVHDSKRPYMVFVSASCLADGARNQNFMLPPSVTGGIVDDKGTKPADIKSLSSGLNTGWWLTSPLMCGGDVTNNLDVYEAVQDNVTNDVIYKVGDNDAVSAVPDGSPVAVIPGSLYDRMGPWPLSGREVWIAGGTPVEQWRTFTELMVSGIAVEGIVFESSFWNRKAAQGWVVGRNIYQWSYRRGEETNSLAVATLQNVYDFWREVNVRFS